MRENDRNYKEIKFWPMLCNSNIKELMDFIKELWVDDARFSKNSIITRASYRHNIVWLELHTNNNPNNNLIIAALEENKKFWGEFWQKSERGGHYYFEIKFFSFP